MPKSSPSGKQWSFSIYKRLHARRPLRHILDVGAGLGTYSAFRRDGQQWTGVEIWGPYLKAYELEKRYDKVIIADIRYLDWQRVAPLDMVILGDVLEHMSKEDAIDTLNRALSQARVALVSIPIVFSDQKELLGNPFETHVKPDWTHRECMESLPGVCLALEEAPIGAYFLSHSAEDRKCLEEVFAEVMAQT